MINKRALFVLIIFTFILPLIAPGCKSKSDTEELTMEIAAPDMVSLGEDAVVKVIFRNTPKEGSIIVLTWYGFGPQNVPLEATIELPSSPGISTEKKKMTLAWESVNAQILGEQTSQPTLSHPDGKELHPGDRDISLNFSFKTLSVGSTTLSLTLTLTDEVILTDKTILLVSEGLRYE